MQTPIVLFVFNRPDHTRLTVESLQKNIGANSYPLYIYSDGPRHDDDVPLVEEVRRYARSIGGFHSVEVIERLDNLGLANSVIQGVTDAISKYSRVIVLEDDMLTSKYFLDYMSTALDFYADDERVSSIHGYSFQADFSEIDEAVFFLRGADCWGWATWDRAWQFMDSDGSRLYRQLVDRGLSRKFDYDGSYPYMRMLARQARGEVDSWAIRWCASIFLRGGLTLWPKYSLVRNIGLDGSGTNCHSIDDFDVETLDEPLSVRGVPVRHNNAAYDAMVSFFRAQQGNIFTRIMRFIRRRIGR